MLVSEGKLFAVVGGLIKDVRDVRDVRVSLTTTPVGRHGALGLADDVDGEYDDEV